MGNQPSSQEPQAEACGGVAEEQQQQQCEAVCETPPDPVRLTPGAVESKSLNGAAPAEPAEPAEPALKLEKSSFLGKMFKKKSPTAAAEPQSAETRITPEEPTEEAQPDAPDTHTRADAPDPSPQPQPDQRHTQQLLLDTHAPVMNFFKQLVTPSRSPAGGATAEAGGARIQKENPPAAAANVQEVPKAPPPPPPPAPPKTEMKAEAQKDEAPAAANSVKSSFSFRLFRAKPVPQENKPIAVQGDASKVTLEVKPQEPPEKKSALGKLFKPKGQKRHSDAEGPLEVTAEKSK